MKEYDADVIVVGAGVAGLACAERLAEAKLAVIVVEARERVGGRILTHYDEREDFPIELGAEFVHGEHPVLMARIEQANLRLRRIDEQPWCKEPDGLQPCGEFWSQTEKVLKSLRMSRKDRSFTQFLRSPKGKSFSSDARDSATRYVEGFNAARAAEISVNSIVRGLRTEEKIDGDKQFRIVNGYAALVADIYRRLTASGIVVETGLVVKNIRWKKDRVEITSEGDRTLLARKAVITLPLGVLQAGAVKFSPALSKKQKALKHLHMGEVIRVALRFRERFWDNIRPREGGPTLRRMGFLFSHDAVFPTWWTQMPSKAPLLIAWSPSRHTRTLSKKPPAFMASRAVKSLAGILGISERMLKTMLVEGHVHDWQADPFSLGAYSYVKRGGEPSQRELARPIAGTLFFAGEAVIEDGTNGTVHGALQSGSRAARELLKSR